VKLGDPGADRAGHGVVPRSRLVGALTGYALVNVTPSGAPISELPLALIPTAAVPLLFALHLTSVPALRRAPRTAPPATAPRTAGAPKPVAY
jgi:hypothetical protein